MTRILKAVLCICIFTIALVASAAADEVFYKITTTDGRVRREKHVPTTNERIQKVERIARIYQGTSTEKGWLVIINSRRREVAVVTKSTKELFWTGEAWVSKQDLAMDHPRLYAELFPEKLKKVRDLRLKQMEWKRMQLARRKDELTAEIKSSRRGRLAIARAELAKVSRELAETETELKRLREAPLSAFAPKVPFPPRQEKLTNPVGTVTFLTTEVEPEPNEKGVTQGINAVLVPRHQTQVWRLPDNPAGVRTYRVRMSHAEAGIYGAFYYIAFADDDGDGTPDRLIAHSKVARAKRAGQWSEWVFSSNAPRVFVGNTWLWSNTTVYYSSDAQQTQYTGIQPTMFCARHFADIPKLKVEPGFSNLRVKITP